MAFPKFIHVTVENQGTHDEFYSVTTGKAENALTSTKRMRVATYQLKEVNEGKLEGIFSAKINEGQ